MRLSALVPFALLVACVGETLPPILPAAPAQASVPASLPPTHTLAVPTRTVDVVDDYFGEKVKDPYRWLEDGDAAEVKAWTDQENAVTRRYLNAIQGRDALETRIKELLHVGSVTGPIVSEARAGHRRYFHTKREGTQDQPVLYVRQGASGVDRTLIDPSTLSADATTALDWWYPSNDGSFVAWGKSEKGSEESTLYIRDVEKGIDLPDRIPFTQRAVVAWIPGNKSFYYTRYPEPGSVPQGDEKYYRRVFLHVVGQDPKTDRLVFGEGRDKADFVMIQTSPDGRYLVANVMQGWGRSEVYVRDLALGDKGAFLPVATGLDALFYPIARNDRLYLHTNLGAPRYRLCAVAYDKPSPEHWKTIVPEGEDVLEDIVPIGQDLLATYLHDAASSVVRFGLDGSSKGSVALPSLGSASVSGAWDGDEAFVQFASFVVPPLVTRIDLSGKAAAANPTPIWDQVGAKFTAPDVRVTRLMAKSKDGTRVPMFVVRRESTAEDGTAPAVLWGYGGFNSNQTPAFSSRAMLLVEHGGVWVSAVLRGGGEFGEAWHQGGMLANKQNVFDDAVACAEELIRQKVTSRARLGIMGGSNGGLLVAAVVTQHPELFRVGASLVPLTDMVRYERYRIAKLWAPEYGSASNPEQFRWLYAYSPYHHVQDGMTYPSMLLTTAESDSRVDPMHALKMAARMQAAQSSQAIDRPILLRVEKSAGHGQGKPVFKLVEELTDEMSFVLHELGVPL